MMQGSRWMLVLLLALALAACGGAGRGAASKTTDTHSAAFATDAEKIAFLEQYLTLASPIAATEFHVVYHDNATGLVPGPSDWDIQTVMLVAPEDVSRWTDGMQPVAAQGIDLAWGHALLPPDPRWTITTPPVVYQRSGAIVAVFEREGIVFKRVWAT